MGALKLEDLPHYTYDDYKHWEDRWELIYGVAYAMSPMPMIKHQKISSNIAWQLNEVFKDCKKCQALLPVDWKIDDETIVQPDNLVICHKPLHEAYITKAPVIIFEVLSKSTANKDLNLKYNLYEKEGVKFYIIVNPDDRVAKVYKLQNGKYIKVCDTVDERVKFEIDECEVEFDFSKIW
ncbi:MAG: Uma2 family endonuclease [Campylobacterales bacterium]|nr:Uma2 family endonuclease [Campylobacterales bacterium]